jgi:hypothetical protein
MTDVPLAEAISAAAIESRVDLSRNQIEVVSFLTNAAVKK